MISTKWVQGKNNIQEAVKIRNNVFIEEMNLSNYCTSDIYDNFAFNVIAYNDDIPVGTGRLLFKNEKYFIDNVCVIKEYRRKHLGDLMVRMLVRKAVNMGAERTFAEVNHDCKSLFESIGFKTEHSENNLHLLVKIGDVGGHCCQ